jgi:hypothetical protein
MELECNGAFPTDPHCTPAGRAQQPGMTGQVKEIFLAVLVSSELMLKTVKLFSIQDY